MKKNLIKNKDIPLDTAIAIIIFNRPDCAERALKEIKKVKPKKMFIIADGPRNTEEKELCIQTRAVFENIDWDCEVFKNYSEKNMGCGLRPMSGINWVFDHVDEAIILEDDCIPSLSFFYYCQELLRVYQDDQRIMTISGNNFQNRTITNYSYYFSKYPHTWGWATWKRAWRHFDYEIKSWPEFKESGMLNFVFEDRDEIEYWTGHFENVYKGRNDIWDYQWVYTCLSNNGLSISPVVNLVTNIGYNSDATHTKNINSPNANVPASDIWEIKHPPFIVRDKQADVYDFLNTFDGKNIRKSHTMFGKIYQKLRQACDGE